MTTQNFPFTYLSWSLCFFFLFFTNKIFFFITKKMEHELYSFLQLVVGNGTETIKEKPDEDWWLGEHDIGIILLSLLFT